MNIATIFTQRSTWAGLAAIATAVGLHFTPEAWDLIVTAGTSLAGLVLILWQGRAKAPK